MNTATDVLGRADQLRSGRTPFVLATVVRAERPTSAKPGDRALVLPDGTLEGFVGGSCAESTVRLQSLRLLETGESTLLRITPTEEDSPAPVTEGTVTVNNPCLSGGTLDIFLEAMLPPVLVYVYGLGPIARALVELGTALGYDVRASDPAAALPADLAAVVVASHGRDEQDVLAAAVRSGVPYVGLVASRRRGSAVLAELDVPAGAVHTPAGLDIGGRTASEIALSIYAELIDQRPRRPATPAPVADVVTAEALDPVCGMTVAITPSTLSAEVGGRRVYFCGPGCRRAFLDQTDQPG
ncbi:MAG TPA: XdhC family protein [Pseudonocardiaceae bacterium]|nr:XdhC family protein [Pseudonocardiaceae bacterium]